MSENQPIDPALIKAAFAQAGRIGGTAGRGKSKKRPKSHYQRIAKLSAKARQRKARGEPPAPTVKVGKSSFKPEDFERTCPKCGAPQTYEEGAWVHKNGFEKCLRIK